MSYVLFPLKVPLERRYRRFLLYIVVFKQYHGIRLAQNPSNPPLPHNINYFREQTNRAVVCADGGGGGEKCCNENKM